MFNPYTTNRRDLDPMICLEMSRPLFPARLILFVAGLILLLSMVKVTAANASHRTLQPSDYAPVKLQPVTGVKPFEYIEAPAPLPNYTPHAKWGTQSEPITTMQKPLNPEESARHMVGLEGFEMSLFAAEPEIINPIWLSWDERGRLWIAETVDYPNEMQPEGKGRDRLKICEDTDNDGRADKFTIFVDKLSIPTSFVFARGGVIVIHSGKTEFFKDTDGDDKADVREVLFEGWGTRDTHAAASNLRYGFDNWIWGTVGYSGFQGEFGGEELRFGQGIFRFKPDGSKMEFVRSSNNNTWGLGLTEDNIIIGSTANGNASMYMPIPNRYYEGVTGWSASRLESIADSQLIHPITDQVRQVDWHGQYTAGSGSAIYTARQFPMKYWNTAQFVAEPTAHLLGLFFLERQGADFVAHNAWNFMASDDDWSSPIYGEVGPEGALWVVDWYNYIIQHNPTPHGFQTGRGNAYDTPLRDKVHGRIYRVLWKGSKPGQWKSLAGASASQLVSVLKHDNMLWRIHAQQMLVARGDTDIVPALLRLVQDPSVDAIGLNPGAIHGLWTLKGLNMLEGRNPRASAVAEAALRHPSPGVRRAAVMVLPRTHAGQLALLEGDLLQDPDAQVRMASLLALSEMPPRNQGGEVILSVLQEKRNGQDRWMVDAATAAAAQNDSSFLRAVLKNQDLAMATGNQGTGTEAGLPSGVDQVVRVVTGHYAQRGPVDTIVETLAVLKEASPLVAEAVLEGLLSGWPQGTSPVINNSNKETLLGLMSDLPVSARDRLLALAQKWGQPELFGASVAVILETLSKQVVDTSLDDAARTEAAQRLLGLDPRPEVLELILGQVDLLTPPALAKGLVGALSASRNEDTGGAVMSHWANFTPAVRRTALGTLMRRPEWAMALLDAVQDKKINRTDIAPEYWAQLKQYPNRSVSWKASQLALSQSGVSSDREEIVNQLLPLAKEKGDPIRGKEVYESSCAICHLFNGQGGKVGPELTGIGSRDRSDILLEILDPNRSVEANYRLWTVETKDGEAYSGRLEAETQTTVEVLDVAAQKHVIQRSNIESIQASEFSIMPIGFEAFPPEDLTSLIEYLVQPH